MSQPDRASCALHVLVVGAREEALVLEHVHDDGLRRIQPIPGNRPPRGSAVFAEHDEARQEAGEHRAAAWREQRLGSFCAFRDGTFYATDLLVVGFGDCGPAVAGRKVVHLAQREGQERQRVDGFSAAPPHSVLDKVRDEAGLEGEAGVPGRTLDDSRQSGGLDRADRKEVVDHVTNGWQPLQLVEVVGANAHHDRGSRAGPQAVGENGEQFVALFGLCDRGELFCLV